MTKKRGAGVSLRALMTVALGAAGVVATPALAQEADEGTEIIVTATQRATALQDVPVAVTAVTADTIENSGIRDLQDLTSVAPSLQFNVSESEASATARLRGVGTQGSNPGLESAVGIFIDGVYRARNGVALTDLGDLQQIEVLRGPQGTLFGRNTSAGIITVATRAPNMSDFESAAELTYGDFGETRVAGSINIPLGDDRAGLRVFSAFARRDGFLETNPDGTNPLVIGAPNHGGGESNSRDVFTIRGQLAIQLTDNLDARIIADISERDETCCAAQIYDPELVNGNQFTAITAAATVGPPVPYGTGRMQLIANLGGYGPNVNGTTPLGALGEGNFGDRTGFANRDYSQHFIDRGLSAEFNLDSGLGTFTSITAYRVWEGDGGSDSDYSQVDLVYVPETGNGTTYRTFTQELRLTGEMGRLDWLVGAFFSDEEIDRDFSFLTGTQYGAFFTNLDNIISGGTIAPGLGTAAAGGTLGTLYNGLALVPAGSGQVDHHEQRGQSLALFTHNIFSLTESTQLTVGLRLTQEEKELRSSFDTLYDAAPLLAGTAAALPGAIFDASETGADFGNCDPTIQPIGVGAAPNSAQRAVAALRSGYCVPWLRADLDGVGYDQSRDEEEWSGVIALRQEFSEAVSAYASYSRGYKGGGFNLDRNFDFTYLGGDPNSAFEAEIVDSYEVGLKTEWFSGDLIANLAVFSNEFENFQLNTFNGIQFVVTTVPEVTTEGAELDVNWRTPIEGLSIQGGLAYTDAAYGEDTGWVLSNRNPITGEQTLARLPNSQLTNAPEWTTTAAATFERPVFNDSMNFLAYIDARWVDEQNTGSDLRPTKIQPEYTLVNARIGLSAPDDHVSLELWARNLFDEEYAQIMFDVPLQAGTAGPTQGAFLGDPRTFGLTLRARY